MPSLAASILVHNERVKSTAGLLNTLSAALVAFGVLRPLFDGTLSLDGDITVALAALVAGFGLHMLGRSVLSRLREGDER